MKRQHPSLNLRPLRTALSTIAVSCLFAACGGGGGGGGGSGIAPATTITLSGNVTSSVGAPLPGALVSLGGVPTTSDSKGDYQLTLDTAIVNTGTIVVVTVAKDGYQSCTGIVKAMSRSLLNAAG
ncbi:MAG: carboxypeptidase-like regulatory domain-containing protein [Rhizobacter sp.]|nr:carboxypeptidase-like regulatory domain-containing protein [Rhizobacter sp.]